MMIDLKITIESIDTKSGSGTNEDGTQYSWCRQVGYLHLPDKPYPVEVRLRIESELKAYPVGEYRMTSDSLYVQNGVIKIAPRLEVFSGKK